MKLSAVNAAKRFIRKRAGSNIFTAVQNTDLILEEGTLTAVSGPSGSGKSTLLNMLSGLLPPSEGQILADDTDIYSMEDAQLSVFRNTHFGVVPQGQTAIMSLNMIENIMVPYVLYKKTKGTEYDSAQERARELMEKAGLRSLEKEMPAALSGGEIRRMAVCRALLMNPDAVLADEPTGDLDEENTRIVMQLLKEHTGKGGTVFVVTHDRQVWEYADRIFDMKAGILSS